MKKQLFTFFTAISFGAAMAQVASPSWSTLQNANIPIPISGHHYMDAIDGNVAWVKGYDGQAPNLNYNYVSTTSNGGNTWNVNTVFPDTNTWQVSSLEAIDANTAWVVAWNQVTGGGGSLWKTSNGGATWSNVTAPGMFTNTAAFANWSAWLTPQVAILNGDPIGVGPEFELWRTTNGGTSWSLVPGTDIPNPLSGEYAVVDLYTHVGPDHIWFGTNRGRVYRSFDAGQTWSVSAVIAPGTGTVLEIDFASPTHGLAYMVTGSAPSTTVSLYNTYDGGVSWSKIPGQGGQIDLPVNYGANEMQPVPGTPGWYVSAGNSTVSLQGLSYSKDNGVTWTDFGSIGIGYVTVDMADRWNGWAGSFSNVPDNSWPGVFKYTGNTFNALFTLPTGLCLSGSNVTVSPVNTSSSAIGPYTQQWSASPAGVQFSSSTASVPVITFTSAGTYTISLDITDASGTNTHTQVISVVNCQPPVANFVLNSSTNCNNQAITFTNTSTGNPTPNYTVTLIPSNNTAINSSGNQYSLYFQDPGIYTVSLLASNISGNSSVTQTVEILECRPDVSISMPDSACRVQGTVEIMPVVNGTAAVQNFTWTILPINAGWLSFAPIGSGTPNGRRLILSNNPLTYSFTTYTITLATSNQYGTRSTSRVLTVTPDECPTGGVSVAELSWTGGVSLFPNPAHDRMYMNLPGGNMYTLKIYNILGAVVYSEKMAGGTHSVDVSAMKKGVYFAEISSGERSISKKFIIE